MKVAVYSIALNEAAFVERWLECSADADLALIADTGSSDGTHGEYRRCLTEKRRVPSELHWVDISIKPWRFDHARNAALALVPADVDVCIALDMDEVLQPGWREALERAWKPDTTRLRHPFAFTQNEDGTPKEVMYGHRIHGRHDYYWRYPMHECLWPSGNRIEQVAWCDDLWIHHKTGPKPTRAHYLSWLHAATIEDPRCERMAFYYGRELMYNARWADAIVEFKRYLEMQSAKWPEQRSEAMRYIGRCSNQIDAHSGQMWFHRACLENRTSRQAWFELAKCLMEASDWAGGYWAAQIAATCPMPKGEHYDVQDMVAGPYDVGGICAYYLGLRDRADERLRKAAALYPGDERLQRNLAFLVPPATPAEGIAGSAP